MPGITYRSRQVKARKPNGLGKDGLQGISKLDAAEIRHSGFEKVATKHEQHQSGLECSRRNHSRHKESGETASCTDRNFARGRNVSPRGSAPKAWQQLDMSTVCPSSWAISRNCSVPSKSGLSNGPRSLNLAGFELQVRDPADDLTNGLFTAERSVAVITFKTSLNCQDCQGNTGQVTFFRPRDVGAGETETRQEIAPASAAAIYFSAFRVLCFFSSFESFESMSGILGLFSSCLIDKLILYCARLYD